MHWFVMSAPIAGAIEFDFGTATALAAALAAFAGCVPGWLAVRDGLRGRLRGMLGARGPRVATALVPARGNGQL